MYKNSIMQWLLAVAVKPTNKQIFVVRQVHLFSERAHQTIQPGSPGRRSLIPAVLAESGLNTRAWLKSRVYRRATKGPLILASTAGSANLNGEEARAPRQRERERKREKPYRRFWLQGGGLTSLESVLHDNREMKRMDLAPLTRLSSELFQYFLWILMPVVLKCAAFCST